MPVSGPRDLLHDPSRFGYQDAQWKKAEDKPQPRAELAAGFYVHQAVLALRRTLAERGIAQTELAARIGVKPDYLGRKMRGESWASIQDIRSWALELGVDLLPLDESSDELLPGTTPDPGPEEQEGSGDEDTSDSENSDSG